MSKPVETVSAPREDTRKKKSKWNQTQKGKTYQLQLTFIINCYIVKKLKKFKKLLSPVCHLALLDQNLQLRCVP